MVGEVKQKNVSPSVSSNDLEKQNRSLRKQLNELVTNARQNEEKMQRFAELELLLISTHSLRDLFQIIINNYKAAFDLDLVTLVLIDEGYELLRFLDETGLQLDQLPELILIDDAQPLTDIFGHELKPVLGAYTKQTGFLFTQATTRIKSSAIIPLVRQGRLIGSLNLGSHDNGRFHYQAGTDFLERLAAIVSICIENSLNTSRLERVGMTDPLTCVYNRRFFEHRLGEVISSTVRYDYSLSCMFLDVDKFKQVNDQFGHQIGDLVLQEVAMIINHHLRGSDVMARYGGEEFVVLLPQTPVEDAVEVAERIRNHLQDHEFMLAEGNRLSITISIGVAGLDQSKLGRDPVNIGCDLVKTADEALLKAKSSGRNQVIQAE